MDFILMRKKHKVLLDNLVNANLAAALSNFILQSSVLCKCAKTSTNNMKSNELSYKGSNWLRQRLLLATLSGKSVRISEIRHLDSNVGLRDYEVNLIRLFDLITNGSVIELNETGTSLFYQPGLLLGGQFEYECCLERAIGFYLEVLLAVGPFCKTPLRVTLKGITNNNIDVSIDRIKHSALPLLKKFALNDEDFKLEIIIRGVAPAGGGKVQFNCPIVKQLRAVQLLESGKVKKIRGTAFGIRVSTNCSNRVVCKSKGILLQFVPDIFITSDHNRGKMAGKCPGFGAHLVAETTNGVFYSAERVCNDVSKGQEHTIPEDLGEIVANQLLDEIHRGGCVDSAFQYLAFLLMTLGPRDVSKIELGSFSKHSVYFLRHLRDFFGVTFNIEYSQNENKIADSSKFIVTCIGVGYSNINKRLF